jgi:hypothetical protein
VKANAAPTFQRGPAGPEPSGKGTAKGNPSKCTLMGLPLGTYRGREGSAGNPRGNRTKSQDLARNLIRPGKSTMLQGVVVYSREVGAGGDTSPHTFVAAAAPIPPMADTWPGRSWPKPDGPQLRERRVKADVHHHPSD